MFAHTVEGCHLHATAESNRHSVTNIVDDTEVGSML